MTQDPAADARSLAGVALRLGAVLAASGPVIMTAFGAGRRSVGWFCAATGAASYDVDGLPALPRGEVLPQGEGFPQGEGLPQGEGPYALENMPGELLFWGVLLLPVLLAGLLLRGSRRAMLAGVAAVGAVLAFGLCAAFFLPGLDPCTGQQRAIVPPWPLIVCYPVAAGTLLRAARSPMPRGRHGLVLWMGAAAAAAWAALFHRLTVTFDRFMVALYIDETPESPWDGLAWWSCDVDRIGLPVVLVALAATARATAPTGWGRAFGSATAAALLLSPLLDIAAYISQYGDEFPSSLADSVRWNLLLAAGLVTAATWIPGTSISRAGTVGLVDRLIHARLRRTSPGRAKDLAVAVVIAAAAVWLVVSSFTPTR
ncbi:hypothetical protein [Nonomuraea rhodomycinica]|uniref:Uncharacterized protein n=1 Tax=Nonomuraea rhodomycinica TaxID=1712872 RepID=A0A7Y6IXL2_9ACTN|nr:hypothetical protein [Nonomuraea rhodomycinica]NUW46289.1 hypothetical protein [Nonomuraea rhodomycinica]